MIYKIDVRGRQCPIPVVETKKVFSQLKEGDLTETWVDNHIAVQNLEKMAVQKNRGFRYEKVEDNFYKVWISYEDNMDEVSVESKGEDEKVLPVTCGGDTVVVLSSDKMGEGDEELGRILMKGFIYALAGQEELPTTILLYNGGAKLSVDGSESLEDLQKLEKNGVEILTCGTCLNHYNIAQKLAVGQVTNMYDICEKLTRAGRIVKP
ncbi:MAG: sulfurtransferase-like selenium metabolism protein YedF [Candidatus Ruminococcus intestinipullorum]|nr:sulfurtransferase-like selenium metabolism protein YedF [Candidatus Ruminococcus intestinipullorum]